MSLPVVRCPICENPVVWGPDSPWRPFCCERCKMIDLGAWAAEEYKAPAQDEFPGVGSDLPT